MRALVYEEFKGPLSVQDVPEPELPAHGALIKVASSGLCMSDWHGWMGHDADIKRLPHVPGHEFSGRVAAVGEDVRSWKAGDRVTSPFVNACGACAQCQSGNQQVCDRQTQPGFTHWGSFAELVLVNHADTNLVGLPPGLDFATAASLGCRFATAFRGLVDQARLHSGEWVAVYGCGGVGLSAIMIACAAGARPIAIDILPEQLEFARTVGAEYTIDASQVADVPARVREISSGGAQVSVDALGSPATSFNSIASLRKHGRHVQIGLFQPHERQPPVPYDLIISRELQILGSHGMQAYRYEAMLDLITSGALQPQKLVGRRIGLEDAILEFNPSGGSRGPGITVIDLERDALGQEDKFPS